MNLARFQAWDRAYEAAFDALQKVHPGASDEIITNLIVDYLMVSTSVKIYHLSVSYEVKPGRFLKGMWKGVPDYNPGHPVGPAPIPYDWTRKERIGISTRDPNRARAWILEAMRAGYGVVRCRRRDGAGIAMGLPESVRRRRRERIVYEAERQAAAP
jgi:hypothetical protein